MAATVTDVLLVASGPRRIVTATVTLDSSAPASAAGESVTANALGLTQIDKVFTSGGDDGWVIQPSGNGSSVSFVPFGTGTATGTNSASVAQLSPTNVAVDLSAVSFSVLVTGL